jgi:glutaredoxin
MCGLIFFLALTIQISSATVFFQNGTPVDGTRLTDVLNASFNSSVQPFPVQFFYNTHCGSCKEAVRYFEEFSLNHPGITVESHDLYNNTTSFALFEEYKKQFHRPDIFYPIIFIGDVGIMGTSDIKAYTEPLVAWHQNRVNQDPITGFISRVTSFFQGS